MLHWDLWDKDFWELSSWLHKTFHKLNEDYDGIKLKHPLIRRKAVELEEETLSSLSFEDMGWTRYGKNPMIFPWNIKHSTLCSNNTSLKTATFPSTPPQKRNNSVFHYSKQECSYWEKENCTTHQFTLVLTTERTVQHSISCWWKKLYNTLISIFKDLLNFVY